MSRAPWLGRSSGRHAAGPRGRNTGGAAPGAGPAPAAQRPAPQPQAPQPQPPQPPVRGGAVPLGAPTTADGPAAPLRSPVTDAARAAAAGSVPAARVPPGAAPLVTIDALGRKCPLPIIMLAERIRDVPVGAVIAVLADDPAAYTDVPAWCGLKSHDCVFRVGLASGWAFGVRRRY